MYVTVGVMTIVYMVYKQGWETVRGGGDTK